VGGVGLLTLAGCGGSDGNGATRSSGTTLTECAEVPTETGGPYPGDGSNGPDVLATDGVVRRDLRSSFGPFSGTASGLPLTLTVTILDLADGCAPLRNAGLYAWHCDGDGLYSMYSQGATSQNWCRGVQATDSSGQATFTTVFPGAYSGRYPHVHFQVYPTVAAATGGGTKLVTSQLAFPDDACGAVYATSGYETSARNYPRTPLERDTVFSDGVSQQMATVTGTPSSGMTATLTIAVSSAV
jgi:protocatechuate 3,4-dioxygenase beta subunit